MLRNLKMLAMYMVARRRLLQDRHSVFYRTTDLMLDISFHCMQTCDLQVQLSAHAKPLPHAQPPQLAAQRSAPPRAMHASRRRGATRPVSMQMRQPRATLKAWQLAQPLIITQR